LPAAVISRAVTIISSGFIVWFLVVLMLEVTQQGVARDIIFEVTSALGTVGLSTGATAGLDEIGKIIIIFTMFIGRIGPMTLFMFLSDWRPEEGNCQYPEAKITLT
jgi:trk system potassium uptake protein TrkH